MDGQNPSMMPETKHSRSWIYWVVFVVIIAAAAALILWEGPAMQSPDVGVEDNTQAISAQLDNIDIGSFEDELQSIDADLNQL